MRAAFPAIFALSLLFGPQPVLAWAPEGHAIVAAIAERELTPVARARVASLLGGGTAMVLDSSWADEIRQQRPETSTWHYVNIEIGSQGYDAARDCAGGGCVVAQIKHDEAILVDPRSSRDAKAEALRFLIHFVADLHQPLHVADRRDRGGNDELFRWHGKRVSLHQIWDQDVVTPLGHGRDDDPSRIAAAIDTALSPQQKAQMAKGSVEDWTNESFHLAQSEVYGRLPQRLPDDYALRESPVARKQIAEAGIRLAAILNAVWH
jgi:hypothetical protein